MSTEKMPYTIRISVTNTERAPMGKALEKPIRCEGFMIVTCDVNYAHVYAHMIDTESIAKAFAKDKNLLRVAKLAVAISKLLKDDDDE